MGIEAANEFDEALEVVRLHLFHGDDSSEDVMSAVKDIRAYWDQGKVTRINKAIGPQEARPIEDNLLFVLYRIQPVMQWQVIARDYIPDTGLM